VRSCIIIVPIVVPALEGTELENVADDSGNDRKTRMCKRPRRRYAGCRY
jgi:hypothetical protein